MEIKYNSKQQFTLGNSNRVMRIHWRRCYDSPNEGPQYVYEVFNGVEGWQDYCRYNEQQHTTNMRNAKPVRFETLNDLNMWAFRLMADHNYEEFRATTRDSYFLEDTERMKAHALFHTGKTIRLALGFNERSRSQFGNRVIKPFDLDGVSVQLLPPSGLGTKATHRLKMTCPICQQETTVGKFWLHAEAKHQ